MVEPWPLARKTTAFVYGTAGIGQSAIDHGELNVTENNSAPTVRSGTPLISLRENSNESATCCSIGTGRTARIRNRRGKAAAHRVRTGANPRLNDPQRVVVTQGDSLVTKRAFPQLRRYINRLQFCVMPRRRSWTTRCRFKNLPKCRGVAPKNTPTQVRGNPKSRWAMHTPHDEIAVRADRVHRRESHDIIFRCSLVL